MRKLVKALIVIAILTAPAFATRQGSFKMVTKQQHDELCILINGPCVDFVAVETE